MEKIKTKTGWEVALHEHLSAATPKHRAVLSQVATPEDIVKLLQQSERKSKDAKVNKLLDAVDRAIAPLREFQIVVDVIIQVKPEIG